MAEEIGIKIKIEGDAQSIKKIQDLRIGLDQLQKELKALNKAEKEERITATEASKARAELNLKIGATRNALRDANVELLKQNDALRKTTGLTGLFKDGLKDIGSSLKGAFIGFIALEKGIQLLTSSIDTMRQFEKQMIKVKAITGANEEEFNALTESAKNLSGAFTALEIGKLQEEFAKLGFTTDDILAATEATIQLSIATGEDLANSANTLAATLNGFGLAATDTQKVVDIMAKSFNDSALGLESFSNAMSQVAPVAKVAGSSIEEATALIEVLVNAGFEGGKAGTALRKIFVEISEQGLTLDQAFSQIRNSVDPLTEAVKLFGVEAASQAVTLATNNEQLAEFTKGLENAEGTAKKTADTMSGTLDQSIKNLSTEWDNLVLSFSDGGTSLLGILTTGLAAVLRDILETIGYIGDAFNWLFTSSADLELANNLKRINTEFTENKTSAEKLSNQLKEIDNITRKLSETIVDGASEEGTAIIQRIGQYGVLYDKIKKQIEVINQKKLAEEREKELAKIAATEKELFIKNISSLTQKQLDDAIKGTNEELKELAKAELKKREEYKKTQEERKKANESVLAETQKLNAALEENTLQRTLKEIEIERDASIKKIEQSKADEKLKEEAINAIKATALNKEKKAREVDSKEQFDKELKALEEKNKALILLTKNGSEEEKAAQIKAIEEKRDFELTNAALTADQKVIIEQEAADAITAINKDTADKQIAEDKRVSEQRLALIQQVIDITAEVANTIVDISQNRADREKQIELDSLKAKNEQGIISQQEYETKRREIEKKAFEQKKKLDTTQVIINGLVAASKTLAQYGFTPAAIAPLALVGIQTAAQVATIQSQQFAEGGFTGDGFGKKDSTGFKQAGVVHEGEYVAPKWVLGTREGSELVNRLENIRTGKPSKLVPNFGYANGGFVKQQQSQFNMQEMEARMTRAVINSISAIPVINNATETASVARKVNNTQTQATFG